MGQKGLLFLVQFICVLFSEVKKDAASVNGKDINLRHVERKIVKMDADKDIKER